MSGGSNTQHFRNWLCLHHQSCMALVSEMLYYSHLMQLLAWENLLHCFSFQGVNILILSTSWTTKRDCFVIFFFTLKCIPYFLIVLRVWPILYICLTLIGSLVIIFQLPNGEDNLEGANKLKLVRQLFSVWGLVPQYTELLYQYLTIVHFILNSSPS
jgi:hypothetical protein